MSRLALTNLFSVEKIVDVTNKFVRRTNIFLSVYYSLLCFRSKTVQSVFYDGLNGRSTEWIRCQIHICTASQPSTGPSSFVAIEMADKRKIALISTRLVTINENRSKKTWKMDTNQHQQSHRITIMIVFLHRIRP